MTFLPYCASYELVRVRMSEIVAHDRVYCTISIDSAWGVTCDQMDEISATSNAGVTLDTV